MAKQQTKVQNNTDTTKTLHRSAKNGQFVSEEFTKKHPSTTVTEHR